MTAEKLPEWLLLAFQRYVGDVAQGHTQDRSKRWRELRLAIHRYAREARRAALEEAAQVCEAVAVSNRADCADDTDECVKGIRALIAKEPAHE